MTVGIQRKQSCDEGKLIEALANKPIHVTPKGFTDLKTQLSNLSTKTHDTPKVKNLFSGMDLLEHLGLQYILQALFIGMNWNPEIGTCFTLSELIRQHHLKRVHRSLLRSLLSRLQDVGLLTLAGGDTQNPSWTVAKLPPPASIIVSNIKHIQTQLLEYPGIKTEADFLNHTGRNLYDVLSGRIDGLDILFPPDTSIEFQFGAQNLYANSGVMEYSKTIYMVEGLVEYVRQMAKKGSSVIRILEIGAGTGSTTIPVLKAIAAELENQNTNNNIDVQYTFTDISNFFLGKSKQRISGMFPDFNLEFKCLDVEQSNESQGFGGEAYDIILAADVFHATQYLDDTLKHTRELLKSGGILALGEIFNSTNFLDITFGLTEGWHRYSDEIRSQNSPVISNAKWESILKGCGFSDTCSISNGTYGVVFAQANDS